MDTPPPSWESKAIIGLLVLAVAATVVIGASVVLVSGVFGSSPDSAGAKGGEFLPLAAETAPAEPLDRDAAAAALSGRCYLDAAKAAPEEPASPVFPMSGYIQVDCRESHRVKIVSVFPLQSQEHPGRAQAKVLATEGCLNRVTVHLAGVPAYKDLDFRSVLPTDASWDISRSVLCLLISKRGAPLPSRLDPMLGRLDPHKKWWSSLGESDCLPALPQRSVPVPVPDCSAAHGAQVVHTFVTPLTKWPGEASLTSSAEAPCRKRLAMLLRAEQSAAQVEPAALVPDKASWDAGTRRMVCLAVPKAGMLTGSLF